MAVEKMRESTGEELVKQLDEAYQEHFNLRLRHATRQLTNYSELGKVRKKIARLKTVIRELEIAKE